MKWDKWLENWDMSSLKINAGFLQMEWSPSEPDKKAAWELYIELLTRITTQELDSKHGDESTALESIFSLFPTTREIIKKNGKGCVEFTKIAVVVLNQKVRPFTAKWHKISIRNGFENPDTCIEFRGELFELQKSLLIYTQMLAQMAGVEDLTGLENYN